MLALRAVGLDVGGMSRFDNAKIDPEFFAGKGNMYRLFHRQPTTGQREPRNIGDEERTLRLAYFLAGTYGSLRLLVILKPDDVRMLADVLISFVRR